MEAAIIGRHVGQLPAEVYLLRVAAAEGADGVGGGERGGVRPAVQGEAALALLQQRELRRLRVVVPVAPNNATEPSAGG